MPKKSKKGKAKERNKNNSGGEKTRIVKKNKGGAAQASVYYDADPNKGAYSGSEEYEEPVQPGVSGVSGGFGPMLRALHD